MECSFIFTLNVANVVRVRFPRRHRRRDSRRQPRRRCRYHETCSLFFWSMIPRVQVAGKFVVEEMGI